MFKSTSLIKRCTLLQSSSDVVSQSFSELEDYALASLQLVTMEASVNMSSNNEVNLKASMKDIALCDMQNGKQDKITGYIGMCLCIHACMAFTFLYSSDLQLIGSDFF